MLIGKIMRAVIGASNGGENSSSPASTSGNHAPATITNQYLQMQTQLHQDPEYGMASVHYAPTVAQVIKAVGAHEVLDYGAGKGRL